MVTMQTLPVPWGGLLLSLESQLLAKGEKDESFSSDVFFFFQAEDGIRDLTVTGVQTCALPIYRQPTDVLSQFGCRCWIVRPVHKNGDRSRKWYRMEGKPPFPSCISDACRHKIGRASCRERV